MSIVLFNTSAEVVAWWMFKYCDDIDQTNDFNWARGITDFLVKQIHTAKKHDKVHGCIPLVLYWMCEHVAIVPPLADFAFPRFWRWDISKLASTLSSKDMNDIDPQLGNENLLIPTEQEQQIFDEILVMDNISDDATNEHNNDNNNRNPSIHSDTASDSDEDVPIKNWYKKRQSSDELKITTALNETKRLLEVETKQRTEHEAQVLQLEADVEELQMEIVMLKNDKQVHVDEKAHVALQLSKLHDEVTLSKFDVPSFNILSQTQTNQSELEEKIKENAELKATKESIIKRLEEVTNATTTLHTEKPLSLTQEFEADDISLTNMPEHTAKHIFLEAEITLLKSAEKTHLEKIREREEKIAELEANCAEYAKALDEHPPVHHSDSNFEICVEDIEAKLNDPKSAVGKCTRSKTREATPRSTKKACRDFRYKNTTHSSAWVRETRQ
ncbi:PREDICTED: uncharacterized protein PFB0145c-like [Erythranthe guttata]|uniref:uncharacterized protein PFB0145c-like n=1 Tax=Erythranthe guttata TaxID=4155 RepID=UPI00064DA78F|nr:PREDICTED: uncharacterized protein PFB0145c-like [Erythranthe guttata]|eukprot:XP_012845785.1 PREDICTED: uncharacterized protein PFB0145c-like [Erythranthe guttata]